LKRPSRSALGKKRLHSKNTLKVILDGPLPQSISNIQQRKNVTGYDISFVGARYRPLEQLSKEVYAPLVHSNPPPHYQAGKFRPDQFTRNFRVLGDFNTYLFRLKSIFYSLFIPHSACTADVMICELFLLLEFVGKGKMGISVRHGDIFVTNHLFDILQTGARQK
jgi:hypothetical protein